MTHDSAQVLELLGAFTSEGGRTPLDYEKVCAPTEVEIQGDRLIWSPGFIAFRRQPPGHERMRAEYGIAARKRWTYRDPSPEMLLQFLRLADASVEAIRTYALRWGVLGICRRHWLPSCHASGCLPMAVRGRLYVYWEPVAAWRHFARQAQALIRYGVAVRQGAEPNRKDVDLTMENIVNLRRGRPRVLRIYELPPEVQPRARTALWEYVKDLLAPLPEDMQQDFWRDLERERKNPDTAFRLQGNRNALSVNINRWLGLGYVRPRLRWDDKGPRIVFSVGSVDSDRLFGHLALQLLVAVSGTTGFALCSACSEPYIPKRAPAHGRLHYCPRCGKRAAWRLAQRKRRANTRRRSEGRHKRQH